MLKTLPSKEQILDWILDCVDEGQMAQLEAKKLTRQEIRKGESAILEWQGSKEWPVIIGYPYVAEVKERDKDGNVIATEKYLLDTGFDLHPVIWMEQFHGFACVRKDVYDVS